MLNLYIHKLIVGCAYIKPYCCFLSVFIHYLDLAIEKTDNSKEHVADRVEPVRENSWRTARQSLRYFFKYIACIEILYRIFEKQLLRLILFLRLFLITFALRSARPLLKCDCGNKKNN